MSDEKIIICEHSLMELTSKDERHECPNTCMAHCHCGGKEVTPDELAELRHTGLDQGVAGEVLLRAGVLTGFIGEIADAQEKAKNLISESLTIFESRRYKKKIAEAQTELALCYWRTGEYNEALDLLGLALAQLPTAWYSL